MVNIVESCYRSIPTIKSKFAFLPLRLVLYMINNTLWRYFVFFFIVYLVFRCKHRKTRHRRRWSREQPRKEALPNSPRLVRLVLSENFQLLFLDWTWEKRFHLCFGIAVSWMTWPLAVGLLSGINSNFFDHWLQGRNSLHSICSLVISYLWFTLRSKYCN